MLSRVIVFSTLILGLSTPAWAKKKSIVRQSSETSFYTGDHLRIQGFHGQVILKKHTVSKIKVIVKIEAGEEDPDDIQDLWQLKLTRENSKNAGLVTVKIHGPEDKRAWLKNLRENSFPKTHITVYMPSAPLEVHWRKGNVLVPNWEHNLKVHLLDGIIKIHGGKGDTTLVHQKGQLSVKKRNGSLSVESYHNNIMVQNIEGPVKISNFEGKTRINQVKGSVHLNQNKGRIELTKGEGELEFKNKSAQVKIIDYKGSVRGRSGSGAIFAQLIGELKVNIRTQHGGVRLKLKNSGTSVDLGTKEGSLFTPRYLRVTRYSSIKVVKGRLRGQEKGRVFVRTNSGNIQIL